MTAHPHTNWENCEFSLSCLNNGTTNRKWCSYAINFVHRYCCLEQPSRICLNKITQDFIDWNPLSVMHWHCSVIRQVLWSQCRSLNPLKKWKRLLQLWYNATGIYNSNQQCKAISLGDGGSWISGGKRVHVTDSRWYRISLHWYRRGTAKDVNGKAVDVMEQSASDPKSGVSLQSCSSVSILIL